MSEPGRTWDGKPIASDLPTGTTVVVWRHLVHDESVGDGSVADGSIELLLLHRAHEGPDYEGDWAWTPPAGCRFPGEAVDTCAARELHEEAGLVLPLTKLDDGEERWVRYVAEAPADAVVTLHDDEHDAYRWVSVDEALRMVRPETVRESIRAALSTIR